MKELRSLRLPGLPIALADAAVLAAAAQADTSSRSRAHAARGARVALRNTFVGDKHAGQTTGEGLNNFGAGWYALTANGKKLEPAALAPSTAGGYSYGGGR
jgi:hypothetical protein